MAEGPPVLVDIHQDEILTGEAVALDVQPLGYFLRAVGALIDVVISLALLALGSIVLSVLGAQGALSEATATIAVITVTVVAMVVLPTAVETATRGRSIGRLAVGGRIVREDGGASGFRQAFIRALVGVLEIYLTVGSVALLVGAFTPRSQRLGDLIAGTYCERTRAPRLPPPAPGLPPGLEGWAAVADVARLPDSLARRIAQFARGAETMEPVARARLAETLASEAAAHVSPVPSAPPEVVVRAVAALRRDRELTALALERSRVASLTAGFDADRDLPAR
ncbi:MAG: RDD family protein [Microbacterium sp.]|uniref:RDD family protein n=1 Tax=Microbacterium sp. TaxID=51671 RepID=UPI0039E3F451